MKDCGLGCGSAMRMWVTDCCSAVGVGDLGANAWDNSQSMVTRHAKSKWAGECDGNDHANSERSRSTLNE